ncbi:DUF84 family protein [Bacillus sp. Marseille-P3661]|uniref:DUF84 family protein n=1 Tax=Bacillus sp. Marseille-P3661 TaxID=1936234 RepID=UPI000C861865|nr:DUF84 family protein [Bacillus sp. Marseille-P3661]
MNRIAVGSKNKTKVGAVQSVFEDIQNVTIIPIDVPSGVSAQPLSDEETMNGAKNRAKQARQETESELGIGLEGGVVETKEGMMLCNWGALEITDGRIFVASGAKIFLPNEIAQGIRNGKELSQVMDEYTSLHNVRSKEGAIGIFTNGLVQREEMFSHIVKLLLGQYLYFTSHPRK